VINFIIVGLGGFCGAIARYGLSLLLVNITEKPLAYFTILIINIIGCFGIGFLNGLDIYLFKPEMRLLLVTGFLGGFTTYSAFAFETAELLNAHNFLIAALNIFLHVVGGLLAVWLGNMLAKSF